MRAPLILFVSTALLTLASAPARAESVMMKPGLWEMKQQPQLDARRQAQLEQAQKTMASMPPEQRKMLEQAMAQRGITIDMAGGVITVKACISEEQAKRNAPPVTDKGNCSHDTQRSDNVIHTHFACTDPASTGDSEVTVLGAGDSFTSKTTLTHTGKDGKPETMSVNGDAHWLGRDCGGLKPAGSK